MRSGFMTKNVRFDWVPPFSLFFSHDLLEFLKSFSGILPHPQMLIDESKLIISLGKTGPRPDGYFQFFLCGLIIARLFIQVAQAIVG